MAVCKVSLVRDKRVITTQVIDLPSPLEVMQRFKQDHLTYVGDLLILELVNSGRSRAGTQVREYEITKNWWEGRTQPRLDLQP
jgi:hypothetical protein